MKLFEYMACMRPVVASDHGQMHEIIRNGKNGILCANDPHEILNKLLFLKDHPAQAAGIGYQGWAQVQSQFNWQRNVRETLNLFHRSSASRS